MAFQPTHDMCIKGEARRDDNTKNNWENVGKVLQEDGKFCFLMKASNFSASFNQIYNKEGKEYLLVSAFEIKALEGTSPARKATSRPSLSVSQEINEEPPF